MVQIYSFGWSSSILQDFKGHADEPKIANFLINLKLRFKAGEWPGQTHPFLSLAVILGLLSFRNLHLIPRDVIKFYFIFTPIDALVKSAGKQLLCHDAPTPMLHCGYGVFTHNPFSSSMMSFLSLIRQNKNVYQTSPVVLM